MSKKGINYIGKEEKIDCDELLDEIIAFQLKKMEKYENKGHLSEQSELAMQNMITLLKMRYIIEGNVHFDC